MRILFFGLFLSIFGYIGAQSSDIGQNLRQDEEVGVSGSNQAETPFEERDGLKLFIPNAFSPNDDGINDIYFISNSGFNQFEITIFDRWGNQVFSTQNQDFRWDGRVRGKKVPAGVYVFVFRGVTNDQLNIRRSGNISIIY